MWIFFRGWNISHTKQDLHNNGFNDVIIFHWLTGMGSYTGVSWEIWLGHDSSLTYSCRCVKLVRTSLHFVKWRDQCMGHACITLATSFHATAGGHHNDAWRSLMHLLGCHKDTWRLPVRLLHFFNFRCVCVSPFQTKAYASSILRCMITSWAQPPVYFSTKKQLVYCTFML